ncbi:MAG: hypothetical protein OXR72_14590 [Gemmatimonadota bacterium]|nr:hypothetical protein [Gemmatimonadota bacterium]
MKPIKLVNRFVLVLAILCSGYGISFGDEIDELIGEYRNNNLKLPTREMFVTNHPSRYFSNSEIGNDNDCHTNFLANHAFWWYMDELRGASGVPLVVSLNSAKAATRQLDETLRNRPKWSS